MNEGQLLQETRIRGQTSRSVSESWPRGPGIFLTDRWLCVCAALGSFAGSALRLSCSGCLFLGCPVGRCMTPVCRSFWSPNWARHIQAPCDPLSERRAAQGWVEVGRDFSGSLSDHKSGLIAELPPTDARCLPGRLSPGKETSGRPPWLSAMRGPLPGCGLQGLTSRPRPHSQSRAAPGPNLRCPDPQSAAF